MPLISPAEPRSLLASMMRSRTLPPARCDRTSIPAGRVAVDLDGVLPLRRSVREFATEPVSGDDLQAIIKAALEISARMWPVSIHGTVSPSILAVAANVIGLPIGIHAISCDGPLTMTHLPSTAGPSWLPQLRASYAEAAVTLLICGDVAAAASTSGAGYAALLVRSGALGHAAWLAALSRGLVGSVFGGSLPAATQAARRCQGDTARHLFTVVLGHPRKRTE